MAHARILRKENFFLSIRIAGRRIRSIRHHDAIPLMRREAMNGLLFFSLSSEKNSQSVAQYRVLKTTPVKFLFQMLQGISFLEPWIQGPVCKDTVRQLVFYCAPCGQAMVLPDAIDNHSVIIVCVRPQPWK